MKLDIRMLLPCDSKLRPIVPLNYLQWLFNADGFEDTLIRFLDSDKMTFEEFDKYAYIHFEAQSFIRYDIEARKIYIWKDGGTEAKTVEDLIKFCESKGCRVLEETPHKCTYGIAPLPKK